MPKVNAFSSAVFRIEGSLVVLMTIREARKLERGLELLRSLYKYIRNSLFNNKQV